MQNTVNGVDVKAGDIVTVPANETNTWTGILSLTKGITLHGLGLEPSGTNSTTKIIWARTTDAPMISISSVAARITGFNIAFTGSGPSFGIVSVTQSSYQPWRIDHCVFDLTGTDSRGIVFNGFESGLIDHCTFWKPTGGTTQAIRVNGSSYASWLRPNYYGNITNVVIENCLFNYGAFNDAGVELYKGGMATIRYCTLTNASIGMHGLDSDNLSLSSARALEVYTNTATFTANNGVFVISRGGTGVVFDNDINYVGTLGGIRLQSYRSRTNYYYLNRDELYLQSGDRRYHKWISTGVSTYYPDNHGTHDGASDSSTLIDSTKSWPVNQWTGGGRVYNITDNSIGTISSNTSTSVVATLSGGTDNNWDPGDAYMFAYGGADIPDGGNYYDLNFPWFAGKEMHGTHTGTSGASALIDSAASWTNNGLVGLKLWNLVDNSKGPITSNTSTSIVATLAGGAENDWDEGDEYIVTSATGTHDGSADATVLTDSTQNWTPGQWFEMYLWNRTKGTHGLISSNTATTVTAILGGAGAHDWDPGDEYAICWAQFPAQVCGRTGPWICYGAGEVIVSSAYRPTAALHTYQTYAPWYEWNNTANGSDLNISTEGTSFGIPALFATNVLAEGITYFNDTPKPGYTPLTYPHPSISTEPPGAISAINPEDDAVDVDPAAITLSWSSSGATEYDIYFGTDDPPVTLLGDDISSSSYSIFPLANDTTYYWTIVASNFTGSTTNTFQFRTAAAPTPPPPGSSGTRPNPHRKRTMLQ